MLPSIPLTIEVVPDLSPSTRAKALQSWGKFAGSSSSPNGHGLSMNEEARNTDRRGFGWSATPLRTQTISFVSAGPLKREEDAWNTVSEDDSPQKQSDAEPLIETIKLEEQRQDETTRIEVNDDTQQMQVQQSIRTIETAVEIPPLPATVNGPSEPISNTIEPPAPPQKALTSNERPPTPSSDSDEEIVFSGRSGPQQPSRRPTPGPKPDSKKDVQTLPEERPTQLLGTTVPLPSFATSTTLGLDSPAANPSLSHRQKENPSEKKAKQTRAGKRLFGRKLDEDELMQDYIDNMALDDSEEEDESKEETAGGLPYRKGFKKTEHFRLFSGDGLENAKVQTKSSGRESDWKDIPNQAIDWDSDDLADFDDLSTTDEEIADVNQIIRHRQRQTGVQYLVIANGREASDAKWVYDTVLISESARSEIKIYEEIRRMNIEQNGIEEDFDDDEDDSEDDSEEEALQDLIDNIESEDDENARIMKYTSRMTDEQIARALAKQEEMGLGSDELMIFDGDVANGTETPDDAFGLGDDFIPFSLSKHTSNRGRSKRNKKQRDSFPSAEAFADALDQDPYGVFDIMDFERPSLRPKKKGRKSDYPFDLEGLEDDDLRDQLVDTWTKDREKKAERKRQREEARLMANLDAADAGDPEIIKARLRQFLVQDIDVLKLSPMEAPVRAAVHRLAKSLKLHSHSEGKEGLGMGRYPVLTKTPRTPQYTFQTIWQVDDLMNLRKFFPKNLYKMSKVPRSSGAARQRRGGGGGVMSGATYRDGEEVAASAPEIGADNRGRVLLEKMGWVAGTGIGAVGNQGGLDPIRHIVKTTKAGLG